MLQAVALAAIDGECLHKDKWTDANGDYSVYEGKFAADAKAKAAATITEQEVFGCVGYVSSYNPYH